MGVVRLVMALKLSLAPVDVLQILGRQASIDAHWSSRSQSVLNGASLFNVDLRLTVPECVVEVEYVQTWSVVMAMPWVGLIALTAVHVALHGLRDGRRFRSSSSI